ncbi:hypothetical protein A3A66_04085 [Microgenomates group bacterium RIFCSPLOWO2_01_FULL_46_13]|nr:MAG: hypothetical protein A2783_05475 [Microgenomates group bacterium RIFCSPHIGHO2_01_FULL_45_11]OGV94966.1 MAG: hypothetical protein A3A66_04085 [Microgenomates group bacterium RIFCSPLOWO2_01_FULL_46_13]
MFPDQLRSIYDYPLTDIARALVERSVGYVPGNEAEVIEGLIQQGLLARGENGEALMTENGWRQFAVEEMM